MRIALIDPVVPFRTMVRSFLPEHEIEEYADGEEFFARCGDAPDLVLVEGLQPRMKPTQILVEMRCRGWHSPLVVMAGFLDEPMPEGATLLVCPFNREQLRDAVSAANS